MSAPEVLLLNYSYGAELATPDALLARYTTLTGWAEAVQQAGARVTVAQRFREDATVVRAGIRYQFIADRWRPFPRLWQVPRRLHRWVAARQPAVIHINGLLFPWATGWLRRIVPGSALLCQHHAERPWRGWRGALQRWGLRGVDGFLFAAHGLAEAWQATLPPAAPRFQIMEGSTHFVPGDQAEARAQTGWQGDPLCLWVGRLDHNKDPLTVLAGFRRLLAAAPRARLYMLFGSDDLLPEVRAACAAPPLREAVTLVGWRPHAALPACYRSADLFLLGSHYEGSGYALAEAMACGCVPVVTDIPSFRAMTGDRVGARWPVGDPAALAEAACRVLQRPLAAQRAAARRHFEAALSWPAIGRQAVAIYAGAAARRQAHG